MYSYSYSAVFLLLCLSACVTTREAPSEETLTFAFISDVHISSTGESASEDLMRTVQDINANPSVKFAVITGDITEFGSDEELLKAREIFERLNKPWYVIPGNHDTNWSESGTNSFKKIMGYERFRFEEQGIIFIGTGSGPNMRMAPGLVPHEDIVWLQSVLSEVKNGQPVIFFNHYPINESLANWYLVIDELKKVNIQAILHGHGHRNKSLNYEGIPAAMGRSNLRGKKETGGYNLVSIRNGEMIFAERTPGKQIHEPWLTIDLENHQFAADTTTYPRPSYKVNDTYSNVMTKWSAQDDSDIGTGIVTADSLVLYANTAGFLIARDIETGEQMWQVKTGGKIYSTPEVSHNVVVFASTDSSVYGVNLSDGSVRWKARTGKSVVASPAISDGYAYIGSSEGVFRALSLETGAVQWTYDEVKGFISGKPLVDEQHIYFGDWGNYFYALDKETGELVWNWTNGSINRMYSPAAVYPVKADGKVFITAPDRYITSLDASSGEVIWRSNKHKGRESIGISSDKSEVYTKSMNDSLFVYSAEADSMKLKWALDVGFGYEISPSPIMERDNIIYIPTDEGTVYAVDRREKQVKWIYKISNALVNYILPLGNNEVLASTMDGKVVRLKFKDS